MEKYKVVVSGLENHFRTYGLDQSDINTISDILKNNKTQDISSVYEEVEMMLGLSGLEILDISRPSYDLENIWFKVEDSEGNLVLEFSGSELLTQEEFSDQEESLSEFFEVDVDEEFENVMLVLDKYEGGLFELNISSDTPPTPSDFSFVGGFISILESNLEFISKIFFKGEVCVPEYTIDNELKSTSVYMVNGDI